MRPTKRLQALIAEEYRDVDGYWIYLIPGWQNGLDPGTHGIVEDTKRRAYAVLTAVIPCSCKDCNDLRKA